MLWTMRPTAKASPTSNASPELEEQGLGVVHEPVDDLEDEAFLRALTEQQQIVEDDRVDRVLGRRPRPNGEWRDHVRA